MSTPKRPVQPVQPCGMELIFFYRCPSCGRKITTLSPTQPAMAPCEACGTPFPIVPVDERTIQFIKIMLAEGRAAVDPDFT
ncbi:MAG: hypothetical protein RR014_03675 [Bilophila sp.]